MSSAAPDPIRSESLRRLHPRSIADPAQIRTLLSRLERAGTRLRLGADATARIERVEPDALRLRARGQRRDAARSPLLLRAEIDGRPYFFAAPCRSKMRGAGDGCASGSRP